MTMKNKRIGGVSFESRLIATPGPEQEVGLPIKRETEGWQRIEFLVVFPA